MNKEKQLRELVNQYGIDTIKKQLKSFETKESPEKWFKNLLSQMTIKQDREKYPYSLFFFLGNEIYMEQDKNYYYLLWVCHKRIWSKLKSKFGLKDQEIRDLIKNTVEEHFKIKVSTPSNGNTKHEAW